MREVSVWEISRCIRDLCITANRRLPEDVVERLNLCCRQERGKTARENLDLLLENLEAARDMKLPVCQDTGMAIVFLDIGQEVYLTEGDLTEAVNAGVRQGYTEGYLRKSVVSDPLERQNTGDNTPAILHTRIMPGSAVDIAVAPKGFGSENMSRLAMLKPAQGEQGVCDFVLETVALAGPNACPPLVVGVGIGGDFELSALLAKRALLRPLNIPHPQSRYASLEERLLHSINGLNIGPGGFGGDTTALAVRIETAPTHIAGLPVAVNLCCHVARHAHIRL